MLELLALGRTGGMAGKKARVSDSSKVAASNGPAMLARVSGIARTMSALAKSATPSVGVSNFGVLSERAPLIFQLDSAVASTDLRWDRKRAQRRPCALGDSARAPRFAGPRLGGDSRACKRRA
jgi:hypothetical protein